MFLWGEGVLSICTNYYSGGGILKTFGKKPLAVPKVPKLPIKPKKDAEHRCYDGASLFEPTGATYDALGGLVFSIDRCRQLGSVWASWDGEAGAWVPSSAPDPITTREAPPWTFQQQDLALVASTAGAETGVVKIPEEGAKLLQWWVHGKDLWLTAKWQTADDKLHVGLYGSAP